METPEHLDSLEVHWSELEIFVPDHPGLSILLMVEALNYYVAILPRDHV